jgi:hypothetical protein
MEIILVGRSGLSGLICFEYITVSKNLNEEKADD